MSTKEAVLTANDAFYAAFRSGDFQLMEDLWSKTRKVAVFHPNWPGIEGREDVMASWYQVMMVAEPPAIYPCDEKVILNGNTAMVICREDLGSREMIATNTFVRESAGWRITHHQASRLPAPSAKTATGRQA